MALPPLAFAYKHVQGVPIYLDVFHPTLPSDLKSQSEERPASVADNGDAVVPAVLFFHGGGLTVGNRTNWFPTWLKGENLTILDRAVSSGFAFISADYQLIPPSSGHHIVEDIKDIFRFLEHDLNPLLRRHFADRRSAGSPSTNASDIPFQIDSNTIAVTGCSAGGLCAYLAAIHATPKPAAIVSFYGMGGNFLTPHYFSPKSQVFFRGREMLDPKDFTQFLHPSSETLPVITDSPLSYHPSTYMIPGYPSNPRMLLARLYLQMGVFLGYFTGLHDPSLSLALRDAARDVTGDNDLEPLQALVPKTALPLFPQFNVTSSWPPTFLVHGAIDSAVPSKESVYLSNLFREAKVESTLRIVDGMEHSFDYLANANELFGQEGGLFDEVAEFLRRHLRRDTSYGSDTS